MFPSSRVLAIYLMFLLSMKLGINMKAISSISCQDMKLSILSTKERNDAPRVSAGISDFVKDWATQIYGIKLILTTFQECVLLKFDTAVFDRKEDLFLIFTFIAQENLPINTDEDNIPHDKIEYIICETGYPTDPFEITRASKDVGAKSIWYFTCGSMLYV